jgi:hypothetical protein
MWIEPLNLEVFIIQVLSGSQDMFLALALFCIFGMSAYFRMNGLAMFFMLSVFLFMFNGYVTNYFILLIGLIGGLLIGYWVSKIYK